tara:strand:- start:1848 stop:2243 length:396 start_codon:yes stop_codon:yes gene_type:complete
MANRDTPNSYFAWYNDDDRLAIVVQQASSSSSDGTTAGQYDTYLDSTVTNGIKLTIHSKYEAVSAVANDLETTCGLDESMHSYVLDYVKSRILEDIGQVEPSQYFRTKFENGVQKKPTRKSGIRTLLVPNL